MAEASYFVFQLNPWDVHISFVSSVIRRNFVHQSIFIPEVLHALLICYFVCHNRSIKRDDFTNVQGSFCVTFSMIERALSCRG